MLNMWEKKKLAHDLLSTFRTLNYKGMLRVHTHIVYIYVCVYIYMKCVCLFWNSSYSVHLQLRRHRALKLFALQ